MLAKLAPTEFRDHLILGYEILKWENDTPQPTVFHPLPMRLRRAQGRAVDETLSLATQ